MSYTIPEVVHCYSQGFFLMGEKNGETLGWYSAPQRSLIPLDERFRYPKSLRRVLNQNRFTPAINQDFEGVLAGCANRESTWITERLKTVYRQLHAAGYAHSFEAWQGETLAGGLLGLTIGGAFLGESMFYRIPDGSKVALVLLVKHLRARGFHLFDTQLMNPHLERFGAFEISASDYEEMLTNTIQVSCKFV